MSPAAARRRLGIELRRLRESAGRKIEDAAKHLDCSTAKISRLENGKGVPYPRDIRDLVELYDAKAELDHLIELAEDGRAQDWLDNFKDLRGALLADHIERYAALERDASSIKSFEPELIPGLLQSEEYVDAVCRTVFPDASDRERARLVDFRMQRQQAVLRRVPAPPELHFAVGELAIIRHPGGKDVLRRQLERLLAELEGPLRDVQFHVTPLLVETPAALGGPFAVLRFADKNDQDVVFLEGRDGGTYLESDQDVRRYEDKFHSLQQHSLSRADSLGRLAAQIERLS